MAKSSTKFRYQPRSTDDVNRRASQRGGAFDGTVQDRFQVFSPKEGTHKLRILPPTWENASHYGLDIYMHYSIGPDNQQYICLNKMKNERCPVCEERKQMEADGEADAVKALAPRKRVAVYVIDRKNESDGPKVWLMPWTVDRDIATLSVDEGEALLIDHPEDGYDIEVRREGAALNTDYIIKVGRRKSPLHDDEEVSAAWLAKITEHPIPEVLQYYSYDHIKGVLHGKPKPEPEDEATEDKQEARRRFPSKEKQEEEEPRKRKVKEDEPEEKAPWEEITEEDVLDMKRPDLEGVIEACGLEIDTDEWEDAGIVDKRKMVIEALKAKSEPEEKPAKKASKRETIEDEEEERPTKKASKDEEEKPSDRASRIKERLAALRNKK